jgi:gliding motility-associated-like protein
VVSAPPAVTIGPYTNPICSGTTDTIVATALPASTVITWVPQAAGDTLVTATPGTYQLQAASPGCTFDTSIVLIAAPSPAVSLPGPYTTCAVDTVVTATPTGGTPGYTYVWSNGGTGPTTIDSILGSSQYSVVVTDANHCTAVSNTEVITTSYPGVAISISPVSDSIFIGDTAVLTATPVGTTAYAYLWSGSATTTVITPMSPVSGIIGDSLGVDTVYLLVTDKANGCTYATYAVINVVDYGMFAMPTAFTPNGDMKNDFFYPAFNGPNSPAHVTAFRIYDRWGQMIYNNPAAPGWDGNYGGTAQPSETYMYFVTIEYPDQNDASRMLQRAVEGSFQLLR